MRTPTPNEAANLLAYLREMERIRALDNESLCREFLAVAPVFGRLGELADVVADRLCPGIVERLESKEPSDEDTQKAMDAMATTSLDDGADFTEPLPPTPANRHDEKGGGG